MINFLRNVSSRGVHRVMNELAVEYCEGAFVMILAEFDPLQCGSRRRQASGWQHEDEKNKRRSKRNEKERK